MVDNFPGAPYIAVDNETGFRIRYYRLFDRKLSSGSVSLENLGRLRAHYFKPVETSR